VVDDARRRRIQPADDDEQRTLWKRVAGERVAMLSTHDPEGTIGTRPVMPVKVEPEGRVWIFTAIGGGIADDIRRDGRVHLTFMNQSDELYVALSGEARVVHDPERARDLWSPAAGVWYPQGPDDANLGLVRIDVHRGDYWNMKNASLVRFFKIATASALGLRPDDVATHRRFTK
jgi:general stress protein 26